MSSVKIGEVCTWAKGASIPRDNTGVDKDIPYLHYGDLYKLYDYRINLESVMDSIIKIDDSHSLKPEQFLHDGDIVFTLTSETVDDLGHCTLVIGTRNAPFVSGMETTVVHVENRKIVNPAYLNYIFHSNRFQQQLRQFVTGMKVYRVHPSDLMNIAIDLPDLATQDAVVSILDSISDRIILLDKINDNLLEIANALYDHYFPYSIEDELPLGWKTGKLGDIIEIHDSKRIPLSGKQRAERAKIYPYYGAASVTDYVDDYLFDGTYLLLGEDGTVVTDDGKPMLQYVFGKFWVNNHAHILTGTSGYTVDSLFLLCQRINIDAIITGAVQPKVSQANLKDIDVVIPPEQVVNEFSAAIKGLFDMYRTTVSETQKLAALRDTLLPKLMSGEIDVSNVAILN